MGEIIVQKRKRGPLPKGKVKIEWSHNFAYAIGLIASDGCLYSYGHINFTSKDYELIDNFLKALDIKVHIGKKSRGFNYEKKYFVIQFGDVLFYKFLLTIGLTPNKSKTLGELNIPDEFYLDFARGVFDGDGCTYSYFDPRWKSSFMFYSEVASASKVFLDSLRKKLSKLLNIQGHITNGGRRNTCYQLKYAKNESLILLRHLYDRNNILSLSRKKLKIQAALGIMGEQL